MNSELKHFQNKLKSLRYTWWLGLAAQAVLWLLAFAAIILLVYGLADFFYALSKQTRWFLSGGLAIGGVVALLICLKHAIAPKLADVATRADEIRGDERRSALSTLELRESNPDDDERKLGRYLREKTILEGARSIKGLPFTSFLSWPSLIRGLGVTALASAFLAIPFFVHPEAANIVAKRILNPGGEMAPWSPLKFEIFSDKKEIIYGESVMIDVTITGAEVIDEPVCVIGKKGVRQELPVFKVEEGRYRIKFDGVVEPLKVAFASGKARSEWYDVDVLLKPQILAAELELAPPAYAGVSKWKGQMPADGVAGLAGTEAKLVLRSNRPVGGGVLRLRDPKSGDVLDEVAASSVSANELSYDWSLTNSGELEVVLRDVRGTEEVLKLQQTVKADAPPMVTFVSPPTLLLATPESVIEVRGEAEDDFSLAKVDLIRSLMGYRDRAQTLARGVNDSSYEFDRELDLGQLGVKAGQVLEFFLEATDTNPELTGIGSSELVRIQVISREDYAERLRQITTLNEFSAKFEMLNEKLEDAKEALDELEKAIEEGDPEAIEQARKKAKEANDRAEKLFREIEKDFPAFDLEKQLGPAAKRLADAFEKNGEQLDQLDPKGDPEKQKDQMKELQKRLNNEAQPFEELKKQADEVNVLAGILEMAAELVRIHRAQLSVAKRMEKLAKEEIRGNIGNRAQLRKLGSVQSRLKSQLLTFRRELEKRGKALPVELADLAQDIVAFLEKMDGMGIPAVMQEAVGFSESNDAIKAMKQAVLAADLIKRLMEFDEENQFCQMCQGKVQDPKGQNGEGEGKGRGAGETLQEMLDAMLRRGQQGFGSGAGGGGGGQGEGTGGRGGGFLMNQLGFNIPMAGPSRMRFGSRGGGRGNRGGGGRGGRNKIAPDQRAEVEADEFRKPEEQKLDLEQVPESYRDAVRRYFEMPKK